MNSSIDIKELLHIFVVLAHYTAEMQFIHLHLALSQSSVIYSLSWTEILIYRVSKMVIYDLAKNILFISAQYVTECS